MKKLKSRKFLYSIGVSVCALVLMCAGLITPKLGITIIASVMGEWVVVEGVLDAIGIVKKNAK